MKLFTKDQEKKLLSNGKKQYEKGKISQSIDFKPVVRLFLPEGGATWLITELDPQNPDIAFGLCDLGAGFPELGYVSISELSDLRTRLGLPVERDRHWTPEKRLSEYTEEASRLGHIGR